MNFGKEMKGIFKEVRMLWMGINMGVLASDMTMTGGREEWKIELGKLLSTVFIKRPLHFSHLLFSIKALA